MTMTSFLKQERVQFIGKYELIEPLDEGGQAQVYRGRDHQLERDVAIKVGHVRLETDSLEFSRILREGALLAKVDHPHLVRIFDSGVDAGIPYLVMEYVEGIPLHDYVGEVPLQPREIRRIMEEISSALEAAHCAGILHLDLKPENVIVGADGHCKLIDFGLGTLIKQDATSPLPLFAGTLAYMSPEQVAGESASWNEATDVFGLGAILCYLLTHSPPGMDSEISESLRDPPLTPLPLARSGNGNRSLTRICQRALAKDPLQRFPSANAFRKRITLHRTIAERILGSCSLIVGVLMLLAGFSFHEITVSAGSENQHELKESLSSSSGSGFSLKLMVTSDSQQQPLVAIWTPSRGLREIKGLRHSKSGGKTLWQPCSSNGTIRSEKSDDFICVLAFPSSVDFQKLRARAPVPHLENAHQHFRRLPFKDDQEMNWSIDSPFPMETSMQTDETRLAWLHSLRSELQKISENADCVIMTSPPQVQGIWNVETRINVQGENSN